MASYSFQDILDDVRKLWRWIVAAAALPLAANLLSLSPPWPQALPYITAIFELLLIVWAFHNLKGASKRSVSRVINFGIPILFVVILIYIFLISIFSGYVAAHDFRYLRGFECSNLALSNYLSQCPALDSAVVERANLDISLLWTPTSLAIVRTSVIALWILFFALLSGVLAAFAVRQRDVAERQKKRAQKQVVGECSTEQ